MSALVPYKLAWRTVDDALKSSARESAIGTIYWRETWAALHMLVLERVRRAAPDV